MNTPDDILGETIPELFRENDRVALVHTWDLGTVVVAPTATQAYENLERAMDYIRMTKDGE